MFTNLTTAQLIAILVRFNPRLLEINVDEALKGWEESREKLIENDQKVELYIFNEANCELESRGINTNDFTKVVECEEVVEVPVEVETTVLMDTNKFVCTKECDYFTVGKIYESTDFDHNSARVNTDKGVYSQGLGALVLYGDLEQDCGFGAGMVRIKEDTVLKTTEIKSVTLTTTKTVSALDCE